MDPETPRAVGGPLGVALSARAALAKRETEGLARLMFMRRRPGGWTLRRGQGRWSLRRLSWACVDAPSPLPSRPPSVPVCLLTRIPNKIQSFCFTTLLNLYYFLVDPISKYTPTGRYGVNARISGDAKPRPRHPRPSLPTGHVRLTAPVTDTASASPPAWTTPADSGTSRSRSLSAKISP